MISVPCLVLPKPGQGLPYIQLYHRRGAQIPESLLHRVSSGVAVRLPRDLPCLLTGSVQAQPPESLLGDYPPPLAEPRDDDSMIQNGFLAH